MKKFIRCNIILFCISLSFYSYGQNNPCNSYFKAFKKNWESTETEGKLKIFSFKDSLEYWKIKNFHELIDISCWIGLTKEELESILGEDHFEIYSKPYKMHRIFYFFEKFNLENLFTRKSLYFYLENNRVVHVSCYPQPNSF